MARIARTEVMLGAKRDRRRVLEAAIKDVAAEAAIIGETLANLRRSLLPA